MQKAMQSNNQKTKKKRKRKGITFKFKIKRYINVLLQYIDRSNSSNK